MKTHALLSLAAASVLLAACGGGGGDGTPASPAPTPTSPAPAPAADTPPASASQTAEGFTAYLQMLAASLSETAQAVDLSQFLPPKSETAEPTPLS